jgi:ABC-type dipeptide/oligopeptide/nickel transport system permease subunit
MNSINKDKFKLVQKDQKIFDEKLKTKSIGYFKDASIRFGRNKANVIASMILLILVLLAVFVPVLSTKNFVKLESQLAHLPPRIPGLSFLGIADGSKQFNDQVVGLDLKDDKTGLYLPLGYDEKYIIKESLTNKGVPCTDLIDSCLGGSILYSFRNTNSILISSKQTINKVTSDLYFSINQLNNPVFELVISEIVSSENLSIELFIEDYLGNDVSLGTANSVGTHQFKVETNLLPQFISQTLQIKMTSDSSSTVVTLDSLTFKDDSAKTTIEGMALYNFDSSEGDKSRKDGVLMTASFKFDMYEYVFADKEIRFFSPNEFDQIMASNDSCEVPMNGDYSNGWSFDEGCPIRQVISKSNVEVVGGVEYFTYHVILDYSRYMGYNSTPFFLFGTDGGGRDLFALTWLGLRTSLLIGVIASVINISIGIVYGSISGYYGGKVDLVMERITEIVGRVPWLVTLSIFIVLIGPSALALIAILIVSGWIGIAGVTRTQFYRYKRREYVLASRTLGAKDLRLIFRHILPNGIGTIITASILSIPAVIFTEAALSYLGYGIGHGQSFKIFGIELSGVSIGVLLSDGRTELFDKPYLTVFPAIIISILMITFNMFGNALRDAFNPSLRGSDNG